MRRSNTESSTSNTGGNSRENDANQNANKQRIVQYKARGIYLSNFWVLGAVSVVILFLAISAYAVFYHSYKWKCETDIKPESNDTPHTIEFVYSLVHSSNSSKADTLIYDTSLISKIDEVNHIIGENHNAILERQETLINDIRQETNNNIDKISAWLAFWIAIMALLGTLLPIAMSLISNQRDEKFREGIKEEIDTKLKEVDIKIQKIKLHLDLSTLEHKAVSLDNGMKSNFLHTIPDEPRISRNMLHEIIERLEEIVWALDSSETEKLHIDGKMIIVSSLLCLPQALQSYAEKNTPSKIRQATKCKDAIARILSKINRESLSSILTDVRNLCSDLYTLAG